MGNSSEMKRAIECVLEEIKAMPAEKLAALLEAHQPGEWAQLLGTQDFIDAHKNLFGGK